MSSLLLQEELANLDLTDRSDGYIFFNFITAKSLLIIRLIRIQQLKHTNVNLNQFTSHKTLVLTVKKQNVDLCACFT